MLVSSPFNLMGLKAQEFYYSLNALLVSHEISIVYMDYTVMKFLRNFLKIIREPVYMLWF